VSLIGPEGDPASPQLVEELPQADARVGRRPPGAGVPALVPEDGIGEEDLSESARDGPAQEHGSVHVLPLGDAINSLQFVLG